MMSADNENMDLGLALGYSNNCTRIRMNESSGAGVNAGASVNLKFPASDSLSELVWSPHKGLSVKCAEGSLPDKRSFLLWNMGPSDVDPSPSRGIRCKGNDDDRIVAGNLVVTQAELHLDSEAAQRVCLPESPEPGLNMEIKDEMEEERIEVQALALSRTQNEVDLAKQQKDCTPESSKNDAGLLIPNISLEGPADSNCAMAEAEASSVNLNKEIPNDPNHTNDNANEEEGKTKFSAHFYMVPSGGKLEYTAENDLQHVTEKDTYQQNEERLVRGCSLPLDTEAENDSSHFRKLKSKEKALSEGNVSRRFIDNEDDSQESVESCNSACLLGKRRWNFTEQLFESKRMKNDLDENIASTSMIRNDSSFMNWISNMVNGFSKVNHEDEPSLDLTLAHSTHGDTSFIRENVICSRLQEPMNKNIGFQTVFQSLYCPNTKLLEAGTLPHVLIDNTDVHISPVSFPGQIGGAFNQNFASDERILPSTEEHLVGQPDKALILSAISPIQNDLMTDSAGNIKSSYQECCKFKNGATASVSLADNKITITDDGNPHHASDGRATCELSNRGNFFGSLWITRFTAKVCSTSLNLNSSKKDDCPAIWRPDDFTAPNTQSQFSPEFPDGEKSVDITNKSNESLIGKELQTFAANTQSSLGSKIIIQEENYQNPGHKLNSAESSHKTRISEAMASTFARRLDALKHLLPTAVEGDSSSRILTCISCGKSDHNLQACSEVNETELVEIVGKKQNSCFIDKKSNLEEAACCFGEKPASHESPLYNGKEFSENRSLSSNETQNQINSNCMENKTGEHQNVPLISFASMDIAEAPKDIFDAVRRLQVSRSDMLKWINSNVSLSKLEGLFLRLRLGKWEAGFDGTGYYVARITVEQSGEALKDCKKSISVNVGGMKCVVGSQYISNHDFLEDELRVWWRRILKTGSEVPSKEDLDSKLKRRITLGF